MTLPVREQSTCILTFLNVFISSCFRLEQSELQVGDTIVVFTQYLALHSWHNKAIMQEI